MLPPTLSDLNAHQFDLLEKQKKIEDDAHASDSLESKEYSLGSGKKTTSKDKIE